MTTTAARVAGLLAPTRDADTDAELVRRFAAERDDLAFVALVRRHGPMVFGVCRRVLRDWHLAEDAFQTAFLVLARRASAITPPGAVAGWLHGVAYRVAKDARRSALRRFNRERLVGELPDPAAPGVDHSDANLRAVIDDELRKLPAKYRELLVACDLEGRPRQPVAESLGIPEGTLSSRLTTARRMLADRLAKRGIAPAAVAGIAAGGPAVEACEVPRALAASAARIGSDGAGTVPGHVAALADGAIRAMTIRALLPHLTGILAAMFALVGFGAWAATADQPTVVFPTQPVTPAAAPQPDAGRLLIMRKPGEWSLVSADGKTETREFAGERNSVVAARLSPDGKLAVCNELTRDGGKEQFGRAGNTTITLRRVGKDDGPKKLEIQGQSACWSADGKRLIVVEAETWADLPTRANWVYDLATVEKKKLEAAVTDAVRDWSTDGKFFVAVRRALADGKPVASAVLLDEKGKFLRTLGESADDFIDVRLSPDNEWALVVTRRTPQASEMGPARNILLVVPVGEGKVIRVADLPENGSVTTACWSPDGKKIAFTWQQVFDKPADATECESFLMTSDRDGSNQQTVTSMKATGPGAAVRRGLGVYDWKAERVAAGGGAGGEGRQAAGPNRILFFRAGQLTTVDPDGKNEKAVSRERELFQPVEAKLSPDGKRVAVLIKVELPNDPLPGDPVRYWLYVRELGEKEPGTFLDVYCDSFAWSADGTEIVYTGPGKWTEETRFPPTVHGIVNVATKKKTELKLPADHTIIDWSSDGKFFLTRWAASVERKEDGTRQLVTPSISLYLMNRDGTEHKRLTDSKGVGMFGRLSPDGKRVLYFGTGKQDGENVSLGLFHLWVLDIPTMKTEPVANVPGNGAVSGLCWSPDGKRIAYQWNELPRLKGPDTKDVETEVRLIMCDPDGKNTKNLATEKAKMFPVFGDVDWR